MPKYYDWLECGWSVNATCSVKWLGLLVLCIIEAVILLVIARELETTKEENSLSLHNSSYATTLLEEPAKHLTGIFFSTSMDDDTLLRLQWRPDGHTH